MNRSGIAEDYCQNKEKLLFDNNTPESNGKCKTNYRSVNI